MTHYAGLDVFMNTTFICIVTQDYLFAIQPNYEQITKLSEKI